MRLTEGNMGRPRIKKIESGRDLENIKPFSESAEQPVVTEDQVEEEPQSKTVKTESNSVKTSSEVVKRIKEKIKKIRSQRYDSLVKTVDKSKLYPLSEAIEIVKKTSSLKFDSTIEVHITLNIDPSRTEQQVRGTVVLPHGTGKQPKILVFTSNPDKALLDLGIVLGDKQTISDIEKTAKLEYDKVIATPEMMPPLGPIAKILGPKGLMPNPKTGTVTTDLRKTIQDLKAGMVEFRTDPQAAVIHSIIGKSSFESAKLQENLKVLLEAVSQSRPKSAKGELISSVYLTSTMGPSVRIDLKSL